MDSVLLPVSSHARTFTDLDQMRSLVSTDHTSSDHNPPRPDPPAPSASRRHSNGQPGRTGPGSSGSWSSSGTSGSPPGRTSPSVRGSGPCSSRPGARPRAETGRVSRPPRAGHSPPGAAELSPRSRSTESGSWSRHAEKRLRTPVGPDPGTPVSCPEPGLSRRD